jgi:hypothetical protein
MQAFTTPLFMDGVPGLAPAPIRGRGQSGRAAGRLRRLVGRAAPGDDGAAGAAAGAWRLARWRRLLLGRHRGLRLAGEVAGQPRSKTYLGARAALMEHQGSAGAPVAALAGFTSASRGGSVRGIGAAQSRGSRARSSRERQARITQRGGGGGGARQVRRQMCSWSCELLCVAGWCWSVSCQLI